MGGNRRTEAKQIGDELYALPPQAFTAERDLRVAQARNFGDRETAAAVARMKRPTVAAWLVNVVALRRPDLVDELIGLGEKIRAAQGTVPPAQLRDLSGQRRKVLDRLLAQARALAAEHGVDAPAQQHVIEAESTFSAAMADEEAARQVRSGRVLRALTYSGFGPVSGLAGTPRSRHEVRDVRPAREAEDAAAAQAALTEARTALDRANATERAATERAERLVSELSDLQRRAAAAEREAKAAEREAKAAEREAEAARRERLAAERALATAERRVGPR